jgi:hypothetical protein
MSVSGVEVVERWAVCCVNDNYEVSDLGRLRNKKTNYILKPSENKHNYMRYKINNIYATASRLIYKSFNPNINIDGLDIDIIDNNKANLKLNNLRPATRQQSTANQTVRACNKSQYKNIVIKQLKDGRASHRVFLYKGNIRICKIFYTLEEALNFRDNKINELFGEFGNNS